MANTGLKEGLLWTRTNERYEAGKMSPIFDVLSRLDLPGYDSAPTSALEIEVVAQKARRRPQLHTHSMYTSGRTLTLLFI